MSKVPAHVFVTAGDLAHLACDAVVISTDAALRVEPSWGALAQHLPDRAEAFAGGARAVVADPAPGDGRLRVLANVGASPAATLDWFIEGGVAAVHCAADALVGRAGTGRPLVAVPLFGSRMGGGESRTGELVATLLPALERAATERDVDVALVLRTRAMYAAVQSHRRSRSPATFDRYLSHALRDVGDVLAQRASSGDLVLFLGAGASIGGGLPSWTGLLHELATDAGLDDEEMGEFASLDALDQGRMVQLRLEERRQPLGQRIAERFARHPLVPLTQAMLASLPVDQVATTNYDQLFEQASRDAGRPCGVLPYRPDPASPRWLLKLHGCTSKPEQIVLTRDDYLRFATSRAALAGIVQALMLTRHMLFVGFSLDDDNFHRIVHDVRSTLAASRAKTQRFGTALALDGRSLKRQLWSRDLDIVSMGGDDGCDAPRRLRILLDYVGMKAADGTAHLLDDRYDGVLSEDEKELRSVLQDLMARLPSDGTAGAWSTPAGRQLARLLAAMGAARL